MKDEIPIKKASVAIVSARVFADVGLHVDCKTRGSSYRGYKSAKGQEASSRLL